MYAHLLDVQRQIKRVPPELSDAPDCPDEFLHIWSWFTEIRNSCGSNGFGLSPISYPDILAWSQLTGQTPIPDEVALMMLADRLFLSESAKK